MVLFRGSYLLPLLRPTQSNTSISRAISIRRRYEPSNVVPGEYPHMRRQVPVDGLKTFEQRLRELSGKRDLSKEYSHIDIGLPYEPIASTQSSKSPQKDPNLERLARKRELVVDLDAVWAADQALSLPLRKLSVARHFNVMEDLFGPLHFFVPATQLNLTFINADGEDVPVCYGNLISARTCQSPPEIDRSVLPPGQKWTLVMSSPDEPFSASEEVPASNELLHWMVSNMSSESPGDVVVPYMPPIPYAGTGFHRFIFLLYQQDKDVDLKKYSASAEIGDPNASRPFSTSDFYREYEAELTPAGLAFFQCPWDESVRQYFREHLTAAEPVFEAKWPDRKIPPQMRHPRPDSWHYSRRHPDGHPLANNRYGVHEDVSFDVYLDRYRDRKDLREEVVKARLEAEGNPLDPEEPSRQPLAFPMAQPMPRDWPSWRKAQEKNKRLRKGRWRLLDGHDD